MSFQEEYRELMAKPVDEIKEDIFFRPDNFQDEPWYGDFQMYMSIAVCQPPEEYALQVRKALKIMGQPTHIDIRDGKTYILPGELRHDVQMSKTKRFYVFKDGARQGSTTTRELAINLIRIYQKLETHSTLRSEFSIIEGEEEFIPYPSSWEESKKSSK